VRQFWKVVFVLLIPIPGAVAQRVPVLPQINLPHDYYYRELYLPQLTSGPSAVAWMPEGKSLVFSMSGKLWRQFTHTETATQLTDDPGYDYQPDVSPDGRYVAFVRYTGDAMELHLLDLTANEVRSLTNNGAVNLEPQWSPDGKTLAFVSTQGTGHFLLHTAHFDGQELTSVETVTKDHKSETGRYYYSAYDHAINPTWSPDGQYIYYVSNREIIHGTGDIVRISIQTGAVTTAYHEETSWRTRPDVSPDGTRLIYSSYLGRNWQQLWMIPTAGGSPIPITYGDFDNTSPRWSPDGNTIAFISNRSGNSALWLVNVFDGEQREIKQRELNFIRPRTPMIIRVVDENGRTVPARISMRDSRGEVLSPNGSWIHADDSRYPAHARFESHYFHTTGIDTVLIPADDVTIQAWHGPEYEIFKSILNAGDGRGNSITVQMKRLAIPDGHGPLQSGDLHVHMNYGGHYRSNPSRLVDQADAENLNYVFNLIVNKEQRIPDVDYFTPEPFTVPGKNVVIQHAQEFHTSSWGHMGLLNLKHHLIIPDYSAYPQTAVESYFPHNGYIADRAHAQQGIVGYVHPFERVSIYPRQSETLYHALPVDAAIGKVDYYELMGFADHKASADVWYQLLNCGIRLPLGAGTDAMTNYASLRGPVGQNRLYVRRRGATDINAFLKDLTDGRGFVTNGPLMGFTIAGLGPGDSLVISSRKQRFAYTGFLRSQVPIDHVEVVYNGTVVATHNPTGDKTSVDISGSLNLPEDGWLLLRVWNDLGHPDLFDLYPYASTNPVFVKSNKPNGNTQLAGKYFLEWVSRIESRVGAIPFRTEEEKSMVVRDVAKAKAFYSTLAR
jgi:Tol biopolymer transport system component